MKIRTSTTPNGKLKYPVTFSGDMLVRFASAFDATSKPIKAGAGTEAGAPVGSGGASPRP